MGEKEKEVNKMSEEDLKEGVRESREREWYPGKRRTYTEFQESCKPEIEARLKQRTNYYIISVLVMLLGVVMVFVLPIPVKFVGAGIIGAAIVSIFSLLMFCDDKTIILDVEGSNLRKYGDYTSLE